MYYPKSQITPNLYTNGDEFIISSTQEIYTGYYYKVSTGQLFTGKTPDDKPNLELEILQKNSNPSVNETGLTMNGIASSQNDFIPVSNVSYTTDVLRYENLRVTTYENIPSPFYQPQLPTKQDYSIGEFRRYFCKKTNEIIYIEIDKNQYEKLLNEDSQILWQLYQPFYLDWQLTGDKQTISRVNKNIVELTMKRLSLPKFNIYLKEDYLKYYQ